MAPNEAMVCHEVRMIQLVLLDITLNEKKDQQKAGNPAFLVSMVPPYHLSRQNPSPSQHP